MRDHSGALLGPAAEWWRNGPVDDAPPAEIAAWAPGGVPAGTFATEQDRPRREATHTVSVGSGGALSFRALLVFTAILLLAPQTYVPALGALHPALLAAAVAIASHLLERFTNNRPFTIVSPEIGLAGCLVAWAVLTAPLSLWPGGSVSFILDLFLKAVAVFWLLGNTVSTQGRLRGVTWALVLMSLPLALTGIRHFLSGDFAPGGTQGSLGRIVGYEAPLTGNPNDLALMLNLILPFGMARLLRARSAAARALVGGIILLDAIAVVLTFSRAGFLTLVTTFAIYVWTLARGSARGWAAITLLAGLAGLLLLPPAYLNRMGTITDIELDPTGSAQARWSDMGTAVHRVLEHPFVGAGAGMNILALNADRGLAWTEVHNAYLQYAVDLGLPGLGLFLALLASCLASSRRVAREASGSQGCEELFQGAVATKISLLAFAVAGMFHPVGYQFYFFYLAGLAVAIRVTWENGRHERNDERSHGEG
jgi:O-Antigen ligase